LHAPVATENGQPITGPLRVTYTVERPESTIGLAGGGSPQIAYPAARTDAPDAVLRSRGSSTGPWTEVPRSELVGGLADRAANAADQMGDRPRWRGLRHRY
jgi:hypothetical protein